jgi:IS30 family transposase
MITDRAVINAAHAREGLRGSVASFTDLARHLDEPDRRLIEHVLDRGMSAARAAHAVSLAPRRAQRHLRRIVDRITSRPFQFVLSMRDDWPPIRRAVAEHIFLRGMSQRQAAARLGLSLHAIRQEVARIVFAMEQNGP